MYQRNRTKAVNYITFKPKLKNAKENSFACFRVLTQKHRAGDEARTRDLQLGRLSLYQLSYSRITYRFFLIVGRVGFEPT